MQQSASRQRLPADFIFRPPARPALQPPGEEYLPCARLLTYLSVGVCLSLFISVCWFICVCLLQCCLVSATC